MWAETKILYSQCRAESVTVLKKEYFRKCNGRKSVATLKNTGGREGIFGKCVTLRE